MSRFIATSAIQGARRMVDEADAALRGALERLGPDAPVAFTNTAYFLPVVYAFTGHKVETLGDLPPVIERARTLLHPTPTDRMWLPYLGETLDSGIATLFAEETLEGVRFAEGAEPQKIRLHGYLAGAERVGGDTGTFVHGDQALLNGPIDDIQLRAWGIQLVDGRMPGFCPIVGCAERGGGGDRARAAEPRHPHLPLGNVNGRSIITSSWRRACSSGTTPSRCPSGSTRSRRCTRLALAARSALAFGGMEAGKAREWCSTTRTACFAWVLALGEVDELKYATAAGAISSASPSSPTPASRRSCRRA